MNFMDKMQLNTAIHDSTSLDLGYQTIGTIDAMQLVPVLNQELMPGESIDVKAETFIRLNPMPVPGFSRFRAITRSFFVPYRTIFPAWDSFLLDSVHVPSTVSSPSAIVSSVPTVTNAALVNVFCDSTVVYPTTVDPETLLDYEAAMTSDYMTFQPDAQHQSVFDIWLYDGSTYSPYILTNKGRACYKTLVSLLGTHPMWVKVKDGEPTFNGKYNALGLLALARVYLDYYWPMAYKSLASYDDLMSLCKRDNSCDVFELTASQVRDILYICSYVQYNSDAFTVSFDQPNSPNSYNYSSDIKLRNLDTVGKYMGYVSSSSVSYSPEPGYVSNNAGLPSSSNRIGEADAPFISGVVNITNPSTGGSSIAPTPISLFLLRGLEVASNWLKRNQLAGAMNYDRYLARYGKALSADQLNRSRYLGATYQDVQIGDVMSTADTADANLGAMSGKGVSYTNDIHVSYKTDEFGMLITLMSLVPQASYFQGVDPQALRITKFDFYQPEWDQLGAEALPSLCLYMPEYADSSWYGYNEQVFGYLPRYWSYKTKVNDKILGNFRVNSINGTNSFLPAEFNSANSWYANRVFDFGDFPSPDSVVHSPHFLDGKVDCDQYKRIFYNVSPSAPDNFTFITNFEIKATAPTKSLFDVLDEFNEDEHGKKVTLDVNGVKMN